ncbi:MAG: hypothetical protein QG579_289 [Patescibacteria group bacterium]|jgi:hypothetical protein|nr:hypothetical protein [Patescibacteria group bacterium]
MSLTSTMITTITSNMCMKPPIVYEVTTPSNHKIISTIAIVVNIYAY